MMIVLALALAASSPSPALAASSPSPAPAAFPPQLGQSATPNPRAVEFVERNPAVRAWALRGYDANHDGWLTSFEAQAALDAFRDIADENRDGHVTVREYESGVAFVRARY